MIRKIVEINEERCNGCGACAEACHEGAIAMINGKARLIRDDYCDGLGDCLPECPVDAISIIEREAVAYDEEAVKKKMKEKENCECADQSKNKSVGEDNLLNIFSGGGCPGSRMRSFNREEKAQEPILSEKPVSRLNQWPVQIQLVPIKANFFENANILVAADCTAFSYGNFHEEFIKNHVTLIGCPKLDFVDYSEKLQAIIAENNIKSLTIVRMEVPCCGGIQMAAENALKNSGKFLPWRVVTISIDGKILED